jgi:hypothetical protein
MGCGCKSRSYRVGQAPVTRTALVNNAAMMAPPSTHLSEKSGTQLQAKGPKSDCGCNGEAKGTTLIHSQAAFPWGLALVGGVAVGWLLRSRRA